MNRFRQLIAAYGASVERWPREERDEAMRLLDGNAEARLLRERAVSLDGALDSYRVEMPAGIKDRILTQLPGESTSGLLDRFVNWLLPPAREVHHLWRPALLAGIPLAVGIILGSSITLDATDNADVWHEELSLMALRLDDTRSTQ